MTDRPLIPRDIVSLIEQSLAVRSVADTVDLFAHNILPPLSYESIDSVRRKMVKRGKKTFSTRRYERQPEGDGGEFVNAMSDKDARDGSRKLAEAIDDYFYRVARARRTTTQAISDIMNLSREELEKRHRWAIKRGVV